MAGIVAWHSSAGSPTMGAVSPGGRPGRGEAASDSAAQGRGRVAMVAAIRLGGSGRVRVLMIEDEPIVRSALHAQLSRDGYALEEAENLAEARCAPRGRAERHRAARHAAARRVRPRLPAPDASRVARDAGGRHDRTRFDPHRPSMRCAAARSTSSRSRSISPSCAPASSRRTRPAASCNAPATMSSAARHATASTTSSPRATP